MPLRLMSYSAQALMQFTHKDDEHFKTVAITRFCVKTKRKTLRVQRQSYTKSRKCYFRIAIAESKLNYAKLAKKRIFISIMTNNQ